MADTVPELADAALRAARILTAAVAGARAYAYAHAEPRPGRPWCDADADALARTFANAESALALAATALDSFQRGCSTLVPEKSRRVRVPRA